MRLVRGRTRFSRGPSATLSASYAFSDALSTTTCVRHTFQLAFFAFSSIVEYTTGYGVTINWGETDMERKAETTTLRSFASTEKYDMYLIFPDVGDVVGLSDLEAARTKAPDLVKAVEGYLERGLAGIIHLPNGDRLLTGPKMLFREPTPEFARLSREYGGFAVKPAIIDLDSEAVNVSDLMMGYKIVSRSFDFDDGEPPLGFVAGEALVCGPADEANPHKLTPAKSTLLDLQTTVAYMAGGVNREKKAVYDLLSLLRVDEEAEGAVVEAVRAALDGDEDWRAKLPDMILFRENGCTCPYCQAERERRVKESGGSVMKH